MIIHFNTIARGMDTLQEIYGNITNNIANAQTIGYKSSRLEVENLFPIVFEEAVAEIDEEAFTEDGRVKKKFEFGTGSSVRDITRDFSQGVVQTTQRDYDLAILGKGFFRFERPDGKIVFSRAGNLHKNKDGYLVNSQGLLLYPPVKVPRDTVDFVVDYEGRILARSGISDKSREVGQISLARFDNPDALVPVGQNSYINTSGSGDPIVEQPGRNATGTISQYATEGSNVNIVKEMMSMVINQRNFQACTKAFQVSDAMLKAGMQ